MPVSDWYSTCDPFHIPAFDAPYPVSNLDPETSFVLLLFAAVLIATWIHEFLLNGDIPWSPFNAKKPVRDINGNYISGLIKRRRLKGVWSYRELTDEEKALPRLDHH